jgi:hypothetical protein
MQRARQEEKQTVLEEEEGNMYSDQHVIFPKTVPRISKIIFTDDNLTD